MTRFLLLAIVAFFPLVSAAKPFQRALVIGGGGISPGVALGMIAGAQAAGYKPDLIITACGSSLGAALYHSFGDANKALAYAKSKKFHETFSRLVKIDARNALTVKRKLDWAAANPRLLPKIFDANIVRVPENVTGLLPHESFPTGDRPKFIVLAARATFGPEAQGRDPGPQPLFKQVYITDEETALLLEGRNSPLKETFSFSRVAMKTETLTGVALSQAARASISDPYYINPAVIGGHYYFGGAIDLFPAETAVDLADEVLMNFPTGLYSAYENYAINSTFGFSQSDRTAIVGRHTDLKWIDGAGTNDLAMDPDMLGVFFINKIPRSHGKFAAAIEKQFRFGYERAAQAVRAQRNRVNERRHLSSTAIGQK